MPFPPPFFYQHAIEPRRIVVLVQQNTDKWITGHFLCAKVIRFTRPDISPRLARELTCPQIK